MLYTRGPITMLFFEFFLNFFVCWFLGYNMYYMCRHVTGSSKKMMIHLARYAREGNACLKY